MKYLPPESPLRRLIEINALDAETCEQIIREVWAYTVFRALDIANYRSSYCSDAKGRFRFTLTVPETDSASAHAFDVEFTNEDFEECHE